jgi:hypothetical protein
MNGEVWRRSFWRLRRGGRVSLACCLLLLGSAATAEDHIGQRVAEAVERIYIHGVSEEDARREVGEAGVAVLLRMLQDPACRQRDNVVAFLTHLGGSEATAALLAFLESPPAPPSIPEEDRALLLAPQALGYIAGRGDANALNALLAITADRSGGGTLRQGARRAGKPASMRDDLLEMSLRGLAFSGAGVARERLLSIASGDMAPVPGGRDLQRPARQALQFFDERAGPPGEASATTDTTTAAAEPTEETTLAPATLSLASDSTQVRHWTGITYANHVATTTPMDDAQLDSVFAETVQRIGRSDFAQDVACCAQLGRSGTAQSFGELGDGLDMIDNGTELSAVLNHPSARFKVVRAINSCGGITLPNIVGCARLPGQGAAVVRMSTVQREAILWAHEYGHNVNLFHTSDSRYIMHGVINGENNALSQTDCNAYHFPHPFAQATTVNLGACNGSPLGTPTPTPTPAPTATPAVALLLGQVTLQGRAAPPAPSGSVPLNVSLAPQENPSAVTEMQATTDQSGVFTLNGLSPGAYVLGVKNQHTLKKVQVISLQPDDNVIAVGVLFEGDANGDNSVSLLDFSVLSSTFARCSGNEDYDGRADFNEDGCVSLVDFSLLASNFGRTGDP